MSIFMKLDWTAVLNFRFLKVKVFRENQFALISLNSLNTLSWTMSVIRFRGSFEEQNRCNCFHC